MGKEFAAALRPALVMVLLFTLLLGFGYPLAVLGIGQAVFPHQANGSLVEVGGKVIGSEIVGQAFTSPRYFNTRPSAAGKGYDANASSGSNLGPASKALRDRLATGIAAQHKAGVADVPADLVTTSASGLDPDLSPAAALVQVPRIAATRRIDAARLRALVDASVEAPLLGLIGEPHVNVLALNRALDAEGGQTLVGRHWMGAPDEPNRQRQSAAALTTFARSLIDLGSAKSVWRGMTIIDPFAETPQPLLASLLVG